MAACASPAFGQRGSENVGPTVSVSGLTKLQNGSYACLVGQQIGCQMGFLGTAPPLPTYSWTLPPNVFDSYIVSPQSAVWNGLQSSQLTQSSITFCFSPISGLPQTQEETVSCTATSGANQYTASATIEVEEPSITDNMNLVLGTFTYFPNATSPAACLVLGSGLDFGGTNEGSAVSLTVNDPPDFVAVGQTGQWIYVQCVTPTLSGSYYVNGTQEPLTSKYSGEFLLDGGVPYPAQLIYDPDLSLYGGFYPTGTLGVFVDSPYLGGLNALGPSVSWTYNLSFSRYALYYPPPPPSCVDYPVPLEDFPWHANGTGASGSPWTLSRNDVHWDQDKVAPTFPQWTQIYPKQ